MFKGEVSDIWKTDPVEDDGNLTINKAGDDETISGWIKLLSLVIFSMKLSLGHLLDNPKPSIATLPPYVEITLELDVKVDLISRRKALD